MDTIVSCPFAFSATFYLTHRWLNDFTQEIEVSWWMIVLPGVIVLVATLLTIFQSIRAALTNPVTILRDQCMRFE